MERFRSTSPESSIPAFSWRKTLRSRGSILDKSSLTSSLPSPVFSKEREPKNPKNMTTLFSQNEIIKGSMDSRRRNTIYEDLPHRIIIERPRSASLQLNPAQLQVLKRKPLRNFTRAHPSSARFGKVRLDSSSESTTATCKVDDALANIRTQLVCRANEYSKVRVADSIIFFYDRLATHELEAQLSEEDVLLQERLDHLTLGIASMQRYVDTKCCLLAVAPTTTFICHEEGGTSTSPNLSSSRTSLLMLSPSQSNILAIAEESWEDEGKDWEGSKKGGGGKGISNYLNLSDSAQGSCEQSLGSCESLTYSDGSLSFGQPSRYSVVMIKPLNGSPLRFSCEDNVFFA